MNKQPLKTSGADVLSSWKRTQKNLRGRWQPPPPSHLYARGLNAKGDDGVLLGEHWRTVQGSAVFWMLVEVRQKQNVWWGA